MSLLCSPRYLTNRGYMLRTHVRISSCTQTATRCFATDSAFHETILSSIRHVIYAFARAVRWPALVGLLTAPGLLSVYFANARDRAFLQLTF